MVQLYERSVSFKSAFTAVVAALGYLEEDGDGKAGRYFLSMKDVDFTITLVNIEHFLQSLLPLTTFLQIKQCNVCQRGNHYTRPAAAGEADTEVWNALFDSAVEPAGRFDIDASHSMLVDKGTVRDN